MILIVLGSLIKATNEIKLTHNSCRSPFSTATLENMKSLFEHLPNICCLRTSLSCRGWGINGFWRAAAGYGIRVRWEPDASGSISGCTAAEAEDKDGEYFERLDNIMLHYFECKSINLELTCMYGVLLV